MPIGVVGGAVALGVADVESGVEVARAAVIYAAEDAVAELDGAVAVGRLREVGGDEILDVAAAVALGAQLLELGERGRGERGDVRLLRLEAFEPELYEAERFGRLAEDLERRM